MFDIQKYLKGLHLLRSTLPPNRIYKIIEIESQIKLCEMILLSDAELISDLDAFCNR
jgi:hypothetical protein